MNLAFADRDFYYGDPYFPPEEPVQGLLSKDYARDRALQIDPARNNANAGPGDPYEYQRGRNPYRDHLERWQSGNITPPGVAPDDDAFFCRYDFHTGSGRRRLDRIGHPQRWVDSGCHRGQDRHWSQPADAEFRTRPT